MFKTGNFYFSERLAEFINNYNKNIVAIRKQPERQITKFVMDTEYTIRTRDIPDNPPPPELATEHVYTAHFTVGTEKPLDYDVEITDFDWKVLKGDLTYPNDRIVRTIIGTTIHPPVLAVVRPPINPLKES